MYHREIHAFKIGIAHQTHLSPERSPVGGQNVASAN